MILGCLKYEILRPYPRPQDDNPLSSRTSGVVLVCHPDGVLFAGRISALNLDCLRGEILHFVQDDKSEVFPLRGCSLRLAWVLRERDRASPFGITKRERDPSALPRPRDDKQHPFIPNRASPLRNKKTGDFSPASFSPDFPRIAALRPSAPCPCRFPSRAPS